MIQGELSIFISLIIMLAGIFALSKLEKRIFKLIFSVIPPLLFCYFLPSLFVQYGIFNIGESDLNGTLAKTILPFCIFYFSLGLPVKKLKSIGNQPLILFLVGAIGVIIGGPLSLVISHFFFIIRVIFDFLVIFSFCPFKCIRHLYNIYYTRYYIILLSF